VDIAFEPGPPEAVRLLQRSGALEGAVQTINSQIKLPTDLHVRVVGADTAARVGAGGPVYDPHERTAYFPWSFVETSRADLRGLNLLKSLRPDQFEELDKGAMVFVLYHELAHGLIDVLDVPIVASEEQTADSFAGILAIESRRGGEIVPLSAAALAEARSRRSGAPALFAFADDHGFDRQRAFDDICLVYGSAPQRFQSLVREGYLPSQRARLCPFDYDRTLRSWRRLLSPWLTDKGGLRPLGG
jgi:hypothetical protein